MRMRLLAASTLLLILSGAQKSEAGTRARAWERTLGINGFGRIGKLLSWHLVKVEHRQRLLDRFPGGVVVNLGRDAGMSLHDVAHYVQRDSTYLGLQLHLYGRNKPKEAIISDLDEAAGTMKIHGVPFKFLREKDGSRKPQEIPWKDHNAGLVIETTGVKQFLDPNFSEVDPKGSVRGHLEAGARKVIVSAPFKYKVSLPEDVVTRVMGINTHDYAPRKHRIISNASCTTTGLAFMMHPLIEKYGIIPLTADTCDLFAEGLLGANAQTIHAVTGSQAVLDKLVKAGATDLRKGNRSILNNIIPTATGAAKALRLVIEEVGEIAFLASAVRVPTNTASIITLVADFMSKEAIMKEHLNLVYADYAKRGTGLMYTEEQNVSTDVIGLPEAAAVFEAGLTHTRPTQVNGGMWKTQALLEAWYDNELGSYVPKLAEQLFDVAGPVHH